MIKVFKKDIVFTTALILAVASSFITLPKIKYIDFKVIIILFNLMLVVKAFEKHKLLDKVAVSIINKCKSRRNISMVLTFLCFFASMLITNDVALLTFVPLAIIISKRAKISIAQTIILQTLAANIGSSFTPIGNPQNLYIFSFFNLSMLQFIHTMLPVVVIGFTILLLLNLLLKDEVITVSLDKIEVTSKWKLIVWTVNFAVTIVSVLKILDYRIAFILIILTTAFNDRSLFKEVDYTLLITFICFFIFIGNLSNISAVKEYFVNILNSSKVVYFTSIGVSQVISNVPSSIFISHFTNRWREILLGVDIGGVGTLIASMASVISYKFYAGYDSEGARKYIVEFTIYNFLTLVILCTAVFLVIY